MVIKYSRLNSGDSQLRSTKWLKNKLPVAFLRQQILLVAIVAASFLLFMITTFFTPDVKDGYIQENLSDDYNFGVIVDCGSSGSRAHIFRWRKDTKMMNIEFHRDQYDQRPINMHITPGLSSFKNNPEKVSDYLEPIMSFISESIPLDRHRDTPVSFLATAGLRLLEDSIQKRIISTIKSDLKARFDFPKIRSQVISGEYEGIYSWLSINSQKVYNSSSGSRSYGMIEMGGASTQVTFELNPEVENDILKNLRNNDAITAFRSEQVRLNLHAGNTVKLFATTFLGLGVNSARESAIDLLVNDYAKANPIENPNYSNFQFNLKDPCLNSGSSDLVDRPIISLKNALHSMGIANNPKGGTFKVHMEGTGNFLNCLNLLDRVLQTFKNERLNCPATKPYCSMSLLGSEFIPYNHFPFVGLSEMFFTTNEMINSAGEFNRSTILHETSRICNTEHKRLLELYKSSPEDRILFECFKASWLLTLLHDSGFKMPPTYENFRTVEALDGKEVDWTMGAMISEITLNRENFDVD